MPPGGGGWNKLGSHRPAPGGESGPIPLPMELADPGLCLLTLVLPIPHWARTHPLEMACIGVDLLLYLGILVFSIHI